MSATSLAEERRLYVPKLVVASPWAENLARHWLNHKSDVKIPDDQDSTTGENENRLHKDIFPSSLSERIHPPRLISKAQN
jgi:hypothetical protein